MNILDKSPTQHLHPMPHGFSPDKARAYKWADVQPLGEIRTVSKFDLNIDGRYQREAVSDVKVTKIAKSWSWPLCGVIAVARRADDTLWVTDGGHRVRAAFQRGEIDELPCIISRYADLAEEAQAFLDANLLTSNVSAYHKYRAGVQANDATAIATKAIMDRHGYTIARGGKYRGPVIHAIGILVTIVRQDEERAAAAFDALVKISKHEHIGSEALKGYFWLAARAPAILTPKAVKRLQDVGLPTIEEAIRKVKIVVGTAGARTCGIGIANAYNHRLRRNKIDTATL